MKCKKVILAAVVLCCATSVYSVAQESNQEKIARAMTAAPMDISANATIMDVDGTVLRQGSNGWTCLPGIGLIPGDKHPMCNDAVWMKWMKAAGNGTKFSTDVIGISYMLAGDALVNNENPAATDPNDGGSWVQEGPHMMMLVPNTQMLTGLSRDPYAGGAYVMWDKTPLVHIMLPVESKQKPSK